MNSRCFIFNIRRVMQSLSCIVRTGLRGSIAGIAASRLKNRFATKIHVELNEEVSRSLQNREYKPKQQPGAVKTKLIQLPDDYIKAIGNVVEEHSIKTLISDAKGLVGRLKFRFPPIEAQEFDRKKATVTAEVLQKVGNVEITDEVALERLNQSVNDKVRFELKRHIYNWTPIAYDEYTSLLYLIGRAAPEYAVLSRIFTEIDARHPEFKPRSFFDFGSGTGTAIWASKLFWKSSIFEYFNVDSSAQMNDLSQILLQGGISTKPITLKGVFFRQFLPATNRLYDLVVCAYSLLDLPSRKSRFQTIMNLWNKTATYLVIVEHGSNAGFQVINEVRDLILNIKDDYNQGHVFSPCPHDTICPKFLLVKSPCKFAVRYISLTVGANPQSCSESYSYVVLKKGKRDPSDMQWPRLVEPVLTRSKHVICRMCTSAGKIDEVFFSKGKHDRALYRCARCSNLGDLLPITLKDAECN